MSEKDLNIKYICNKTLLEEKDKLVPIILEMIQESYKAGLCQSEFDNTMGLIEENAELKKQLEEKEEIACNWKDSCLENAGKIEKTENQQQEFIKYLEDEINKITGIDETKISQCSIPIIRSAKNTYKEVLQKYKEIIGDTNDKK